MSSTSSTPPRDVQRLPRADGSVFLVTGGNAGIGYFVAEQLSATGATVVLGSRNPEKAEVATASIRSRVPGARVRAVRLDLADLSSLRTAVESLDVEYLDAVVHNAPRSTPRRAGRPGTVTSSCSTRTTSGTSR
jgi:NAD(P)-dependent dehydrogenase (short-subunit alcohol dehydrogenase family)